MGLLSGLLPIFTPTSVGASPDLTPSVLLPGDAAIGNAAAAQDKPQIAAGGGGYLVVWEDWRTNFAGVIIGQGISGGDPSGQTVVDIYAARLDENGQLIDTVPIAVSQASYEQTRPRVSWNGQNWLIAWNTRRVANFTTTVDVVGARVSPDGRLLDTTPIAIDTNPTIDELYPTLASDGNDWVVVWMDQGQYFELDATRISPEGVIRDPGGVPIYRPQFPEAPYNPSIAFAGDEYLVTFQGYGSSNDIAGLRISPTLQPIGGRITISNAPDNQYFPEVASNGTDFFVAWHDERLSQIGVYGARVNHSGQVLDPSGINISGSNTGYPYPDVAWDGTQWYVTWIPYSEVVYVARVSTGGQVLDPNGIAVGNAGTLSAIAGAPGGGARVVWGQDATGGAPGRFDVSTAYVSPGGAPSSATTISLGAPSQRQPDLAPNGSSYLAVFVSEVSNETRIKGQRVDADGNAIDQEPFLIAGGSTTFRNPRVAWNGSLYLVVWEDTSTPRGFVSGAIFGKRVGADGTVLDANAFEIIPGNMPDVEALGDTFLVVSTHEATNHIRPVKSVRVSGSGAVLGSPVNTGSSYALHPRLAALGGRWLVTWQRRPTHDNPNSSILANLVNPDGTPAAEFLVAPSTSKTPNVAAGPTQGLIVYYRSGDLYGRRILPDGTLIDPSPGFQITTAPNDQLLPSIAWDGTNYVIVYEDRRNVPYLDHPISDIFGTRVNTSGAVLDPTGFPVADDFIPEIQPVVSSIGGSYLIGFANFKYAPPFASYRIDIRRGTAGAPPEPEATRSPTGIPTSTPPVCIPGNYAITEGTGSIVPGTLDTGNHCDECATLVSLPFPFTLYDQTYNTVEVTANGTMNFVYSGNTGGVNFCLPYSGLGYSIVPHWDDLTTENFNCAQCGIFTSVSGVAPNRIFNIEWRAQYWQQGGLANFEVRLYENVPQQRFDILYGTLTGGGSSVTVGVQRDTGQRYTQWRCNTGTIAPGTMLTFTMNTCATPTPVNTPGGATSTAAIPTLTRTATSTGVPSSTSTIIPSTAIPSATAPAATATNVAGGTATATGVASTATSTAQATATTCSVTFSDVAPNNTFYANIRCLACRGIIGGYADGTFRPGSNITRGQIAKMVSNSAGFQEPITGQSFEDVPTGSPFYEFIERLYRRGHMGGYPCGQRTTEPCNLPDNRPYFRPTEDATRGQLSKIVSNAAGYNDPVSGVFYADVDESNPFYVEIMRLTSRGVMSGYPCGGEGEPCDPQNRPYFRWGNPVTRGQASKIVANTFYPGCNP
jgi:hypothetical protein